jgi:hypothetical protein
MSIGWILAGLEGIRVRGGGRGARSRLLYTCRLGGGWHAIMVYSNHGRLATITPSVPTRGRLVGSGSPDSQGSHSLELIGFSWLPTLT